MAPENEHHEHAGDHAGHGHEDELFPRLAVSELVGDAESSRVGRERWQSWLLGLGLAVLALGLPQHHAALWTRDLVIATAERLETPHVLGPRLVRLLAGLAGLSIERAWFLVSALTYGVSFPLLVSLLRAIGFTHVTSMLAGGVVIAAPITWLGATLPSSLGLSLVGAILVARALFARIASRLAYAVLVSLAWIGASLAHPENALLAPVVAFAVWPRGKQNAGSGSGLLVVALAVAVVVWAVWPRSEAIARYVGFLSWEALAYLISLGVSTVGLFLLWYARRLPEESPPPRWLVAWSFLAVAPMLLAGPPGACVLPVMAIGIADWLDRKPREDLALRQGAGLLAAQVALTIGLAATQTRILGIDDGWRPIARENLEPADHVLTRSEEHLYLLRYRWGLTAALEQDPGELAALLEAARRDDARVVLDRAGPGTDLPAAPEPLLTRAGDYWVLTSRGLERSDN